MVAGLARPPPHALERSGRAGRRAAGYARTRLGFRGAGLEDSPEQAAIVEINSSPLLLQIHALGWADEAIDALAELAAEINQSVENIGARRLHTVLERLLEDISFSAPDRGGETITIDAETVRDRVAKLAENADLSRFIL